jgi:hypothetical protein
MAEQRQFSQKINSVKRGAWENQSKEVWGRKQGFEARPKGKAVLLDGTTQRLGRELVVSEVNRRLGLAGPSHTEAPGDDQSIIASPQTDVASGHSINDGEQRDEPERRENILDHCCTPS